MKMNTMCSRKLLENSEIVPHAYRNTDVRDICEEFEQNSFTK